MNDEQVIDRVRAALEVLNGSTTEIESASTPIQTNDGIAVTIEDRTTAVHDIDRRRGHAARLIAVGAVTGLAAAAVVGLALLRQPIEHRSVATAPTSSRDLALVVVKAAPPAADPEWTETSTPTVGLPAAGSVVGVLRIPTIAVDVEIRDADVVGDVLASGPVTEDALDLGPVHDDATPYPGDPGAGPAVIHGHRTAHGAPFLDLDRLAAGDTISWTAVDGKEAIFEVTGSAAIANDADPAASPSHADLVLVTMTPKYTDNERLAVYATLIP